MIRLKSFGAAMVSSVALATLVGCSSGGQTTATAPPTAATSGVDLSAAGCPETITVQTDWIPQSEYGYLYSMIGDGYVVDADQKSVSGPLYSGGEPTGVNLEILTGGPAIGYQTAASQLGAGKGIYLATIGSDEAIQASENYRVTSVFAPEEISPAVIMWDPATYPGVSTIAELSAAGATIRYGQGSAFMTYLIDDGTVQEDLTDPGYDGTFGAFIAGGGKVAQYGYLSNEVYALEHETDGWDKPVAYQLIADTGYSPYVSTVATLTKDVESESSCLQKLVPVMQRATVDYFADPDPTNELIVELNEEYNLGFGYSLELAEYAAQTQVEAGLSGNGPDDTIGNFDDARMQEQYDIVTHVMSLTGQTMADGLSVDDLYTNRFIDPTIGR